MIESGVCREGTPELPGKLVKMHIPQNFTVVVKAAELPLHSREDLGLILVEELRSHIPVWLPRKEKCIS